MHMAMSLMAQAQGPTRSYDITDVLLMDGREAQTIPNATVVVEDGVITAAGQIPIPQGMPVLAAPGMTLMPGFIDLHIHLDLIGHGDYDRFYNFIGGTERLAEVMPIAAKQMLRAGVTTAVDLGSPFDILAVRERIRSGEIPGPRLIVSGPWITRIKLDGVPDSYQMVINTPQEAVAATNRLIDSGSDVIKTWLGLSRDDLKAVVRTAHERGVKVHSHLYKPEAIEDALAAGVDVLQHVGSAKETPYPADLVRRIAAKRVPVVQTIAHRIWVYPYTESFQGRLRHPSLKADMPPDIYAEVVDSTRDFRHLSYFRDIGDETRNAHRSASQFIDANAYMGVGTDAASPMNFHYEAMWHELRALVESGMTPRQALSAATKTGAQILGLYDRIGTIEPGKQADMILIDGNPLLDINATRQIVATIKEGTIWYDQRRTVEGIKALGRAYADEGATTR
jgi:imidazolonepropionase-like amidohydrolase